VSALHAEVTGRGKRDLVLLHGWGMNLRVFDGLAEELARRFRVIAIDLPGHGRSAWDPSAPHPAAQAFRVHETLAALTTRYHLLGWSLGGQFALDLAAAMPAAIERLVLVATTPRFLASPDWSHGLKAASLARLEQAVRADPKRAVSAFLRLEVEGCTGRSGARTLATLKEALATHGSADPAALAWGLERLRIGDLRPALAQVRKPALVIAGGGDQITPAGASRALARDLPKGRYRALPQGGHVPFLSRPRQFATLLREFLRG
jgi:pimeloyl-[acyl-carrier protein] methyl ester esterase